MTQKSLTCRYPKPSRLTPSVTGGTEGSTSCGASQHEVEPSREYGCHRSNSSSSKATSDIHPAKSLLRARSN